MTDIIVLCDNDTALKEKILAQYQFAQFLSSTSSMKQILGAVNSKNFWVIPTHTIPIVNLSDIHFDEFEKSIVNKFYADDGSCLYYLNRTLIIKKLFQIKNENVNSIESLPIKLHNSNACIKSIQPSDIIVIEYDEGTSDFNKLNELFPGRCKKVENVSGIYNAHKRASELSSTSHFYVVDADCIVNETFKFDYEHNNQLRSDTVYVWNNRNASNNLEYGNGGIKLFHTSMFIDSDKKFIDMTMSVARHFKSIEMTASRSRDDATAFSAWRRAFRESVKLTIANSCEISKSRLNVWMNNSKGQFAQYTIHGARDGNRYALDNINNNVALLFINDFEWLKTRFCDFFGANNCPPF